MEKSKSIHPPKKRITHMGATTSENDGICFNFVDTIMKDMDTTRKPGNAIHYLETSNNKISQKQHVKAIINAANEESQSYKIAEAKFKKLTVAKKPLMEKCQKILKQLKHNRSMPKPRAHLAEKHTIEESLNSLKPAQKKNSVKMSEKNSKTKKNPMKTISNYDSNLDIDLCDDNLAISNQESNTSKSVRVSDKKLESAVTRADMIMEEKNQSDQSESMTDSEFEKFIAKNKPKNKKMKKKQIEKNQNKLTLKNKGKKARKGSGSIEKTVVHHNLNELKNKDADKGKTAKSKVKLREKYASDENINKETHAKRTKQKSSKKVPLDTKMQKDKSKLEDTSLSANEHFAESEFSGSYTPNSPIYDKNLLSRSSSSESLTEVVESNLGDGYSSDSNSSDSESESNQKKFPVKKTSQRILASSDRATRSKTRAGKFQKKSNVTRSRRYSLRSSFKAVPSKNRSTPEHDSASSSSLPVHSPEHDSDLSSSLPVHSPEHDSDLSSSLPFHSPEHDSDSSSNSPARSPEHNSASSSSLTVRSSEYNSVSSSNLTVHSNMENDLDKGLPVETNVEEREIISSNRKEKSSSVTALVNSSDGFAVKTPSEDSVPKVSFKDAANNFISQSHPKFINKDYIPFDEFCAPGSISQQQKNADSGDSDIEIIDVVVKNNVPTCNSLPCNPPNSRYEVDPDKIHCSSITDTAVNENLPNGNKPPIFVNNQANISAIMIKQETAEKHDPVYMTNICQDIKPNNSKGVVEEDIIVIDPLILSNVKKEKQNEDDDIIIEFEKKGEPKENSIDSKTNLKRKSEVSFEQIEEEMNKYSPSLKIPKIANILNAASLIGNELPLLGLSYPVEEHPEQSTSFMTPSRLDYRSLLECYKNELKAYKDIRRAEANVEAGLRLVEAHQAQKLNKIRLMIQEVRKRDPNFNKVYETVVIDDQPSVPIGANVDDNIKSNLLPKSAVTNPHLEPVPLLPRSAAVNPHPEPVLLLPRSAVLNPHPEPVPLLPRSAVSNPHPEPVPVLNLVSDLPMTFIKTESVQDLSTSVTRENSVPCNVLLNHESSIGANPENTGSPMPNLVSDLPMIFIKSENIKDLNTNLTTENSVLCNVLLNPENSIAVNPENTGNYEQAASPSPGVDLPKFVKIENDEQLANLNRENYEQLADVNSDFAHVQFKEEPSISNTSDILYSAHVPEKTDLSVLGQKCAFCGKNANAACQRCAKVFFCSNKCGKLFWNQGHKDECGK